MKHSNTTQVLTTLFERNVHFVLCKKSKAAITPGWQNKQPSLKAVLKHATGAGLLGFVPAPSGLWILDVDRFPSDEIDAGPLLKNDGRHPHHLRRHQARRSRILPTGGQVQTVGNRTWSAHSYSGEIRADRGYCILWSPAQLVDALGRLAAAEPVDVALFPKPPKAHTTANGFVKGNRTDHLNKIVYGDELRGQTDHSEVTGEALAAGLPAEKVDITIRKAVADAGAKAGATFDSKNASTLETVFEQLGWQTRYNLRSMRAEWSTDSGATWESTTDRMEKKKRREISETFFYRSVKEGRKIIRRWFMGAIPGMSSRAQFSRITRLIPSGCGWKGRCRDGTGPSGLHRLLTDMFKAEDSPLTRWASTALLLGPVQRCFEPGCKLDEIVILVGGQGIGKSTLLSHLLPPKEPSWFSDSLTMSDNLQKMVEALQGRVLVELSDLQGFRKADMQSLKSFITRRDDGSVRLSFRRNPETMQRRCVLVGTADRAECLPNDSAGLRRFVPVVCREGCDVERFMAAHRNQLWSEALSQYRESGGATRANLPRALMSVQGRSG